MNYEKKYKEALERARQFSEKPYLEDSKGIVDYIFPELKESEDESIRKAIHIYLDWLDGRKDYQPKGEYSIRDMIAWLEKQGEHKLTDKVEPKFKVGDFIVNDYCMGKVIELTNDAYLLDTGQGIPFSCEHNAHLWTIKDAKDGDVLACEKGWTCIFRCLNDNLFSSHCFMDSEGWFCEYGGQGHTLDKRICGEIHPATKEQRDLLFQKMHEAGYEWSAEKKELRKIEQEENVELTDFESVLFSAFSYAWQEYLSGKEVNVAEWVREHSAELLKAAREQKPACSWSEEDEKMFNSALWHIKNSCGNQGKNSGEFEVYNWLKTIKERYTKKTIEDHYELEEFAKIVRGNLTGISKAVQKLFEAKYLQLTGNKMYGGYKD